jgi:hypothetical protein
MPRISPQRQQQHWSPSSPNAEQTQQGRGCGGNGGSCSGAGRSGGGSSAMEVLVLENSELRRQNTDLAAQLSKYEARFGRI